MFPALPCPAALHKGNPAKTEASSSYTTLLQSLVTARTMFSLQQRLWQSTISQLRDERAARAVCHASQLSQHYHCCFRLHSLHVTKQYRRTLQPGLRTKILPLDRQAHCFGCKEEGDQPETLGQGKGILPQFPMSTTLLCFASSSLQHPCQASMTLVVQGLYHPWGGWLMIAAGRIRM
jgi:hypothetical protein